MTTTPSECQLVSPGDLLPKRRIPFSAQESSDKSKCISELSRAFLFILMVMAIALRKRPSVKAGNPEELTGPPSARERQGSEYSSAFLISASQHFEGFVQPQFLP
ncbi:hypothetical protein NPIL_41791 [Nephila pilipes]|uniref:Uncharacterized protein n=1 Tax=Nephila pilipes TaxID=299642 RepID=A0A8X6TI93_NEPPI|nr:hypothetical protein NPIL_41791 [Nephila pilipes]